MDCQKCGQDVLMPFRCPYCGGQFCSEHRLPENHQCPQIAQAQAQKQEAVAEVFTPPKASYEYSISFGPGRATKPRIYMSHKELMHLIPAALLIIGIGFSIVFYNNFFNGGYFELIGWGWTEMSFFATLLTASFLIHEMAHKIIAQRQGLWAEFRLTTWGAVITLISVFTPLRLISPGAVMIAGPARLKEIGRISIAGPITNITLALIFLGASFAPVSYGNWVLLVTLASFNAFIALFNLIPFGVLDGLKIFTWNKKVWAAAFAVAATLTVLTYVLNYLP
jgi:Zn-dependent protease